LMKPIDPRRTLFGWGSLKRGDADGPTGPGNVIDLRALTFALTDRSHTLESACEAFGVEYTKRRVTYGTISHKLLDYAREDVAATAALFRACVGELERHPGIDLQPGRLYSPATVGTRYLEAMGVRRPLFAFTDLDIGRLGWSQPGPGERSDHPLDPRLLGWWSSAFFGGRAEARIVRTPVPVVVADATSMYPLVNANLGTWRLFTAEWLKVEDASAEVRNVLTAPDLLERCLERSFWREVLGVTLVELEDLAGSILPVRGAYDPTNPDPGIGVNPLRHEGRLWYALPDVVASVLLSGVFPKVRRALRLVPVGQQRGLRPVRLRGGRRIDPRIDDPFVVMVEERARVASSDLPEAERQRLGHFLKITANATSYGTLARFDRREETAEILAYGPDSEPRRLLVEAVDDPGPYTCPPIAASITAGARLMLALLERLLSDAGGTYCFVDTDSMAIVATRQASLVRCTTPNGSGKVRAVGHATVRSLLERFQGLNPFDPALVPDVWKIEQDSLRRPLWCWAISAKRYGLYRLDAHGAPVVATSADERPEDELVELVLEDWSEHGLGQYLDPVGREGGRPDRRIRGRRSWIGEAWSYQLRRALGEDAPRPAWADRLAVTQFSVSGPSVARWFARRDATLDWPDRMRPGSFGLLAQPLELLAAAAGRSLPAAPYDPDPQHWEELAWYDRTTGKRIRLAGVDPERDPIGFAAAIESGTVPVRTLGDVLDRYDRRPEHKSLAPDGTSAGPTTAGLLRRRPVRSAPALTRLAGKEGHKLLERATGQVLDPTAYRTEYGYREDPFETLALPVLRRIGITALVADGLGSRRALERAILPRGRRAIPHAPQIERLIEAAVAIARRKLDLLGGPDGEDRWTVLARYLALAPPSAVRTCRCGCGRPVSGRQIWSSEACRKRYRRRAPRRFDD
jgi:hypothetical protein